eukprot:scaffold18034_cov21-Tisochrysis_lutea.AAC.1
MADPEHNTGWMWMAWCIRTPLPCHCRHDLQQVKRKACGACHYSYDCSHVQAISRAGADGSMQAFAKHLTNTITIIAIIHHFGATAVILCMLSWALLLLSRFLKGLQGEHSPNLPRGLWMVEVQRQSLRACRIWRVHGHVCAAGSGGAGRGKAHQ